MAEFNVRRAVPEDVPRIIRLIKDLALYEKEPESIVETSEKVLLNDGFGPNPWFHCMVAEELRTTNSHIEEKKIVGYMLYFHSYSTWQGRMLYLEDLFVEPTSRGKGIGKAMLRKLAEEAIEKDCCRIHWMVLDWNKPSQAFYESIGANCLSEWKLYRMDRKAMFEYVGKTPTKNSV